jgi:hypothetical protein
MSQANQPTATEPIACLPDAAERHCLPGPYEFGIASNPEEIVERLKVVTERYSSEEYLDGIQMADVASTPERIVQQGGYGALLGCLTAEQTDLFHNNGLVLCFPSGETLFLDKYHWQSIQYIAKKKGLVVGSARLILEGTDTFPSFPLPTTHDPAIQIAPEWMGKAHTIRAEFSHFVKRKGTPSTVPVGILRFASMHSSSIGVDEWLATIDGRVIRLLNGGFFNFCLPKIGPSVRYLGSESTPVYIHIADAISNASRGNPYSKALALFLRGCNDVPGFEWYSES